MRPDVAVAFDRMSAAARADGISLIVVSAFRSDTEQARLFAAHPDPKWVARPGTSLHRLGTELDLGPSSAYGWLAAHAGAFHFLKRYPWEPWHFGYTLNAGSASVGQLPRRGAASDGAGGAALEHLGRATGGAATPGVRLQPGCHLGRRGTRDRPVHARHRAHVRP